MAIGMWRIRSAQKIIAPVRTGMIVTSPAAPGGAAPVGPYPCGATWSMVICRASSRTRSAIRSCGIRIRSMSPRIRSL
jgi:hypothetical protein